MNLSRLDAIFLDRDGVINHERADYVKAWSEFVPLPGAFAAIAALAAWGVPVIVISNQSAIGRGIVAASEVAAIHRRLQAIAGAAGGRIDDVFVCPHRPDEGCRCRKPQPGLLLQAARRYSLDLANTVFVGDSVTDCQAALAAGCRPLLVRSGRQGNRLAALLDVVGIDGVPILADLTAAVAFLQVQTSVSMRSRYA